MKAQPSSVPVLPEQTILSAWREQLAQATPSVSQTLLGQQPELLPRFAAYYTKLQNLPRRVRRDLQRQFRRVRGRHRQVVRTAHPTKLRCGLQRKWKQSLAGVALLLALGQAPALGATINVGGGCLLVDAITAANTDNAIGLCRAGLGKDTLVLRAGSTHTLTTVNNSTPYGLTGLPVITSDITIAGNNSTIVRSQVTGTPEFRLLAVGDTGNLTLQGLIFRGGVASGASYVGNAGGGILNQGRLTLTNSTVSGNAAYSGGGVFSNASLAFTNSIVSGNTASKFGGGVQHSSRDGFTAGNLTFTNSIVSGNRADRGGGVHFNAGDDSGGRVTFTNSTVSGNTAADFGGPAFSGFGGGVYINNSSAPANSSLTFTNSTVSGNTTSGSGGGVSSFESVVTFTNSTVSRNTATTKGGGVYGSSMTTLARTLISGNLAPAGAEVFQLTGGVTASNFNLFGHNALTNAQAFAGFTPGVTDITATSDGSAFALTSILNPLANNGGLTQTHALTSFSPAIDGAAGCRRRLKISAGYRDHRTATRTVPPGATSAPSSACAPAP